MTNLEFSRDQYHAPIAFNRDHRGYYYTEPTFRLSFPQSSQEELVALFLAERMMHQFRGTPFERDLRQAIAKLGAMLHDGVSLWLTAVANCRSVLAESESGKIRVQTAATGIAKARFPRRREKSKCAAPSSKLENTSDSLDCRRSTRRLTRNEQARVCNHSSRNILPPLKNHLET
jgi:hypothetical protein